MNKGERQETGELRFVSPEVGEVFVPSRGLRGRSRLGRVGALLLLVIATGAVAASPAGQAIGDFLKAQANEIIAKDNDVSRQISGMYRTPEFKNPAEGNLSK